MPVSIGLPAPLWPGGRHVGHTSSSIARTLAQPGDPALQMGPVAIFVRGFWPHRQSLNNMHAVSVSKADGVMVAEADGGGWGGEAYKVFEEFAKLKSALTGELENTCALQIQQSLNLVLHRENARAILRRHPFLHHEDCLHTVLSAATTIQSPV